MKYEIRTAERKDYLKILDILNQAIRKRNCTALLTPATFQTRKKWFQDHQDGKHPIFVAMDGNRVAGWMAVTAYRDGREGFSKTGEVSYYIDEKYQNQGVASALMEEVLERCRLRGFKSLMAVIFADNRGSIALAEKFGFEKWGLFPGIIEIDGETKDCLQYGRAL